jgi:hypothetical protein
MEEKEFLQDFLSGPVDLQRSDVSARASLDLSNRLLATQREIYYLHTQLADTEDTMKACQMI